jgi:HK97 family phage prohead protease
MSRVGDLLERCDEARLQERVRRRVPMLDLHASRTPTTTGDNSYVIEGHAAVTRTETVLGDMGWLRIREVIADGAFTNVLAANPDVHLNIGHDMQTVMARTGRGPDQIGGLSLAMDHIGLATKARVSAGIGFVRDLAEQMGLGLIDQMSFAFTIAGETRTETEAEDGSVDVLYEITEVGELYDVCVCAQGAYPQTDSSIRTLSQAVERGTLTETEVPILDRPNHVVARGPETIDDTRVSGGQPSTQLLIARARAQAGRSRIIYPM